MLPKEATLKRRLLIFAPSFEPALKAGGPARTQTNLVRELGADYRVDVVTPDRDLGDSAAFPGLSGRRLTRGTTTVYYLDATSPAQVLTLLRRLAATDYDLIMLNSIWNYRYSLIPAILKCFGILRGPVMLSPHGELEPGALALKAPKKRLGGIAFRQVHLRSVALLGATSAEEATNAASWMPSLPVITSPNNTPDSIPWGKPGSTSPALRAVYLSRIHPTKGLLPLLVGLGQTTSQIQFSIIGPVEDSSYWQQCQAAISALPSKVAVTYTPLAHRDEIPPLLWNSDCLFLLTAGENYGHVIAEALQAGCPVITTPTTPWTRVVREGGGQIVEDRNNSTEVAAALERWAAKTPEELADTRLAARDAFETFANQAGPNIIALALEALYGGKDVVKQGEA